MSRTKEAVAERFGQNLYRERRRTGLSQERLGRLASLHRTEIGLLEAGGRTPRLDTFAKLCSALSVDADALLDGIFWIPPVRMEIEGHFSVQPRKPR